MTRISTVRKSTAALAHELNQPLTAILSNSQAMQRLVARESPDMAEIPKILSDIIKEYRRASGIIHKIRAFLKQSEFNLWQGATIPLQQPFEYYK
jgi:two-component system sensor kinase FixL